MGCLPVLCTAALSYLQRNDGKSRKNDGDNPETYGDFSFVLGRIWALDEIFAIGVELRISHAEVVMNGCSLEDSLPDAMPFA